MKFFKKKSALLVMGFLIFAAIFSVHSNYSYLLILVKSSLNQYSPNHNVEEFIINYLSKNPSVRRTILRQTEKIEEQSLLTLSQFDLMIVPNSNSNHDYTIFEFLDYNCGYCRRFHEDTYLKLNNELDMEWKIIHFPVLSEESQTIAVAIESLREIAPEKQLLLHEALINATGFIDLEKLQKLLVEINIDLEELQKSPEYEKAIQQVEKHILIAENLGIRGTPAFVIGDRVTIGFRTPSEFLDILFSSGLKTK